VKRGVIQASELNSTACPLTDLEECGMVPSPHADRITVAMKMIDRTYSRVASLTISVASGFRYQQQEHHSSQFDLRG
jgi:hypothetical protein